MTRKVLLLLATAMLAGSLLVGGALANGDNGEAIGQDDLRLALTKCSNAGGGNGGEYEAAILLFGNAYVIKSECLDKHLGKKYSAAEIEAILAQSACVRFGPFVACEVDPGNSADHNQATEY